MPSLMVVVALVVVTALYWMPAEAHTLSDDATLSALSVSPRNIIGFDADRTSYEVGVDPTVTTATVSTTASHARASVTFHPADADDFTPLHSVALSAGRNLVTVTVTAEDGTTIEDYTVSVNRGVTDAKGWQAGADLDGMIAAGNNFPLGIWSDRTTMWVADSFDDMLYAYRLSDGTRDAGKDITLVPVNAFARCIWSNGTTMWVSNWMDPNVYAYQLSNGARDAGKDITLNRHGPDPRPTGIWSDGTTMWVTDHQFYRKEALWAYRLSDGTRDAGKDIPLAPENNFPEGFWSDGTTVWVADAHNDRLYAYLLSDGTRDPGRDFDTRIAVGFPVGVWSDGTTMWVSDVAAEKVYAYNMPPPSTDDAKPGVALVLTPSTINESGTGNASTVTATLSAASGVDTTVTVSVDPAGSATLSANTTLTIAAGQTASTGTVTITAVDDSAYTGSREVAVQGSASNSVGVDGPDDVP